MGQLFNSVHLSKTRFSYCMACLLVSAIVMQPADARAQESTFDQAPGQTNFDIVVRLSEELFTTPKQDVSRTTRVRPVIVGVQNVGTADVTGDLKPDFHLNRDGISMDLVFTGTSVSHTVGRQRAAQIHATSTNRVHVKTPISFEVDTGFSAGPSTAKAWLVDARRCVSTHLPGLRGRLVRNIAKRRIREKQCQIELDTEAAARTRVKDKCQLDVQERVAFWNERWGQLRQIISMQPWYPQKQVIHYATTEDHIVLYIEGNPMTPDGVRGHGRTFPFPVEALPPAEAGGLVDVIFYGEPDQKAVLDAILILVETLIHKNLADEPIADKVSFNTSAGEGWSMLSVTKVPVSD